MGRERSHHLLARIPQCASFIVLGKVTWFCIYLLCYSALLRTKKNVLGDYLGELKSSFVLFCLVFTGARRASSPLLQSYLLLCPRAPGIRSQRPALGDQQAVGTQPGLLTHLPSLDQSSFADLLFTPRRPFMPLGLVTLHYLMA